MILHDITGTEDHPEYQSLEVSNVNRQLGFIRSMVSASINLNRPFLSQQIIKALNFHAITCLHTNAGEYRPCPVEVGDYQPPPHFKVPSQMDDFTNTVNLIWYKTDEVALATYVLWRLNHIHPFINGNGRTARAAAYFVLCVKSGGWLSGSPILPELLKNNRAEYVAALKAGDKNVENGEMNLSVLHKLLSRLLAEQVNSNAE